MARWSVSISRRILWPSLFLAVLLPGLVSLSRCFSPTLPACSFICNKDEPRCPEEYECRSDNYCHLKGSSEACPYSMDLSPLPPDMLMIPDLAPPPDMAPADM
jgi:hypothetical protein